VRSDKAIRRSVKKNVKPVKKVAVRKEVMLDDKPASCPSCGDSKLWLAKRMSRVVFDLKFTSGGIKRWVIRYRYNSYRCAVCKAEMTMHRRETKYGQNLRAYVAYLLIEMRLSHQKIREHVATVFNIKVTNTLANDMKALMASKYEPTYRRILEEIANGPQTAPLCMPTRLRVWFMAEAITSGYLQISPLLPTSIRHRAKLPYWMISWQVSKACW